MRLLIASAMLFAFAAGAKADENKAPAAAPAVTAAPETNPLDGKMFSGKLLPEGKKKGDKDDLLFKDGKFTSSACTKYGFEAAPYKTSMQDGKTMFEVEAMNPKGEKMDWKGWLDGGKLSAAAVYTNKKGKQMKYNWKDVAKK